MRDTHGIWGPDRRKGLPSAQSNLGLGSGVWRRGWRTEAWLTRKRRGQDAITWLIADKLVEAGYVGIRVPSYAPNRPDDGANVVFFTWTHEPPTMVRVIDDDGRLRHRPLTC